VPQTIRVSARGIWSSSTAIIPEMEMHFTLTCNMMGNWNWMPALFAGMKYRFLRIRMAGSWIRIGSTPVLSIYLLSIK